MCESGNLEIEPAVYVAVEENEPSDLEIWKVSLKQSGNLEICESGNSEIWNRSLFCILSNLEISLVTIAVAFCYGNTGIAEG